MKVNWNRTAIAPDLGQVQPHREPMTGSFALGDAGGPCLCDGGSGTGKTRSHVGTVGHTWTLGTNFVVDGNFAVTQREQVLGPDYGQNVGLDVLGIPGTNGSDIRQSGFPQFDFTGYTGLGNQNNWTPALPRGAQLHRHTNVSKIQVRTNSASAWTSCATS